MTLKEILDVSALTWPIKSIKPLSDNRTEGIIGNNVRNLLPSNFVGYVKIFDYLYDHSREPHEKTSWKRTTEDKGLRFVPELSYWSFGSDRWPEHISPERSNRPTSGLCREATAELIGILSPFTDRQECYFYFDDWKTWCGPRCFFGKLEDMLDFYVEDRLPWPYNTPTYVWPENKVWCFKSSDDLDFVVVGGERPLINAFLVSTSLEAIEVQLDTRIDAEADTINLLQK